MLKNNNIRFLQVVLLLTTLSIMVYIFFMSSQEAETSSKLSYNVSKFILSLFSKKYITSSETEKAIIINNSQGLIRKLAHFSMYFCLGISVFADAVSFSAKKVTKYTLCPLFCLVYAISDEIHQLFVPGRSGEVRDVIIDFCGSIIGIVFIMTIVSITKRGNRFARE